MVSASVRTSRRQVRLVGEALGRGHLGPRRARAGPGQRALQAQDAPEVLGPVAEHRQAAPVQRAGGGAQRVGEPRDVGAPGQGGEDAGAEGVVARRDGTGQIPERAHGVLGGALGELVRGGVGPHRVEGHRGVAQLVGAHPQAHGTAPVGEAQADVAGAVAVVVTGAGVGAGDDRRAAVPDQVEAAVGQDRRRAAVARPEHHPGPDRPLAVALHGSMVPVSRRGRDTHASGRRASRRSARPGRRGRRRA